MFSFPSLRSTSLSNTTVSGWPPQRFMQRHRNIQIKKDAIGWIRHRCRSLGLPEDRLRLVLSWFLPAFSNSFDTILGKHVAHFVQNKNWTTACDTLSPSEHMEPFVSSSKSSKQTAHLVEPIYMEQIIVLLLGTCSVGVKWSLCEAKAEHTSLSVSTYKRLSFRLLKCYLINIQLTLNISTAGAAFVIVEMAGKVGHRWELLPRAGVEVWAAGRSRWAQVIDTVLCWGLCHSRGWEFRSYKKHLFYSRHLHHGELKVLWLKKWQKRYFCLFKNQVFSLVMFDTVNLF